MERIPWTLKGSNLDLPSADVPESSILIPETDADREEMLGVLAAQGVEDRMSFNKSGINGRLDFPESPQWMGDGAVQLSVSTADGRVSPIWFWIVETAEPSVRRSIWCSAQRHRDSAWLWL
jgi:hypothetical protein